MHCNFNNNDFLKHWKKYHRIQGMKVFTSFSRLIYWGICIYIYHTRKQSFKTKVCKIRELFENLSWIYNNENNIERETTLFMKGAAHIGSELRRIYHACEIRKCALIKYLLYKAGTGRTFVLGCQQYYYTRYPGTWCAYSLLSFLLSWHIQ